MAQEGGSWKWRIWESFMFYEKGQYLLVCIHAFSCICPVFILSVLQFSFVNTQSNLFYNYVIACILWPVSNDLNGSQLNFGGGAIEWLSGTAVVLYPGGPGSKPSWNASALKRLIHIIKSLREDLQQPVPWLLTYKPTQAFLAVMLRNDWIEWFYCFQRIYIFLNISITIYMLPYIVQ